MNPRLSKKLCPTCGKSELKRNSSVNYIGGAGYVSNTIVYCADEKCGHTEVFGPRW